MPDAAPAAAAAGYGEPRELMRQKEDLYKSLNLADPALSNAALIQAMVDNPKLIERPIVVSRGGRVLAARRNRFLRS